MLQILQGVRILGSNKENYNTVWHFDRGRDASDMIDGKLITVHFGTGRIGLPSQQPVAILS